LLFHILWQAGMYDLIDVDSATCIYTGMLTDTGNFSYNSNDPDLYSIISLLLAKGLDKDEVYTLAWNTHRAESLRINGYALYRKMQIIPEHQLVVIILDRKELNEFSYVKGDTEGLVNRPLAVPGVTWSVYLRQDEADFVKVSMRSKGRFPVNLVCERLFGGGGHLNAAGGEFTGTAAEALELIMNALDDFDSYLDRAQS
ncbi:MAG: bifunctional oligoribonuclease/PAP phosphatase NrnA, partial [Paramuribaculum sp.]|nr:bifunctional oligoribonuclease/PAP phosphatase NrnA [Paramuribaculum sp.]